MKDNFDEVLRRVFAEEGGYTNDPNDPGGPTNWGITIFDARKYWKRDASADDVRAMPKDVAKRIYRTKYWDAMRCDELPSGVDYAVMDYGVNSGISRSIKVLEKLIGLPEDGKADDTLIRTVANLPPKPLITELCNERLAFLKRLKTFPVFGRGWTARVSRVRAASLIMAGNAPLPAPKPVEQSEHKSESPKTERPDESKPAIKSKTIWAQIMAVLTALGGALTDWKILAVILIAAVAAFVIWDRLGKPDIRGWFR